MTVCVWERDKIKAQEISGVQTYGVWCHFQMMGDLNVPLAKIIDFYNITIFISSISVWLGAQTWSKPRFTRCWTNTWLQHPWLIALMSLIPSWGAMHLLTPHFQTPEVAAFWSCRCDKHERYIIGFRWNLNWAAKWQRFVSLCMRTSSKIGFWATTVVCTPPVWSLIVS